MSQELNLFKKAEESLIELESQVEIKKKSLWEKFHNLEREKIDADDELLKDWLKEYWLIYPSQTENEYYVAVPKFIDFSVGWLSHTTGGYNIFQINKYTQWLGEIPDWLRGELKIEPPIKISVSDGNVIFEEDKKTIIEDKFGDFITSIGKNTARIKEGKEFDLIAQIIDSGSLPFLPQPVLESDLRKPEVNFDFSGKYSFQQEAYQTFLKYGAIGVYWMTGAGKSFLTMYILDSIIGRKALVVPTLTLKEQWMEYFEKFAPRLKNEVEIITYQAYDKIKKNEYAIIAFDECHVLPADTFSKLATLKTKYRIGLSATPYREDNRTNYIFALTGYPIGLDWGTLLKILGKKHHEVNVYIVANEGAKISLASNLLNRERKTILFVNELRIGERLANLLGLPFIHGATKNRMEIAKNSKAFVASRVMELGISMKDLEHIIEVDFLFGSRREETQRTGRLFHSESDSAKVHDIIMTKEEFENYGKRLHGLVEKGFRINLKPMVSGGFKLLQPKPNNKKVKTSSDLSLVDELFNEGFFRTEKTFTEVCSELENRGVTAIRLKKANIFSKLNSLVTSKQLFKDARNGKKVFVMR
jgi:DNA excision repair protein ERCC-3